MALSQRRDQRGGAIQQEIDLWIGVQSFQQRRTDAVAHTTDSQLARHFDLGSAAQYTRSCMRDEGNPKPSSRSGSLWKILLVLAVLVSGYFGVAGVIRWRVDGLISRAQGKPMPSFELVDTAGRTWSNSDLQGKITVLNFFRSLCASCRVERDAIFQLAQEADGERLQVLGVLLDRVQGYSPELTAETLELFAYSHPILVADTGFVDAFHGAGWANVTPVTYVVDASGTIVSALRGHQGLETLRAATR